MPLLVQCPRGCQVKMPRSRAGRIVRCPECKCAMRVPQLTESQLKMGRVIPCRAKLARRRKLDPEEAAQREKETLQREANNLTTESETEIREQGSVNPTVTESVETVSKQAVPPPPPQDFLHHSAQRVPEPPKPKGRILPRSKSGLVFSNTRLTPFINLEDPLPDAAEEQDWEERLSVANQDRKLFARFFAICLCLIAVLNVIPAGIQWYHWAQLPDSAPLPRWIYIQMLIGAIYLIYAFFLAQVPDWSALRAVSVAMLFMAFVFGIISTGMLVGGHGDFSGFLGIPYALNRQACIWCVAMLCVATLMSFWGGKESAHWQRAEQILRNIVTKAV